MHKYPPIAKMVGRIILIFIFSSFIFLFARPCRASNDNDFQYWNSESIEVKLGKNWKIKIKEEFRFGDNAGSFYYNHADAGLSYRVNEYLELSANYRQIFQKKGEEWNPEYRPHINGTVKLKWYDFGFKDRNRFEYRIKENADISWRYRNKLSVDLPFKWTVFAIQPYVADEIFIDFDNVELRRNRLYLGFKMNFLKNLKGEVFYLRQSTKSGKWENYNVFGTALKVVF